MELPIDGIVMGSSRPGEWDWNIILYYNTNFKTLVEFSNLCNTSSIPKQALKCSSSFGPPCKKNCLGQVASIDTERNAVAV